MKRILGLLSLATVIFAAAACQQENLPAAGGADDTVTATLKVSIPDAMKTKAAFGDASGIQEAGVKYEIYKKSADNGTYDAKVYDGTIKLDENLEGTLELKLIRFETYGVFFWASTSELHKPDQALGLQRMTIDYTPNMENDAFAGRILDINAEYDFELPDVVLKRPFAQLNFATDDLGEGKNVTVGDLELSNITVIIPNLAGVYDNVNGIGVGADEATQTTFTVTEPLTESITFDGKEYTHMLMFYALPVDKKFIGDIQTAITVSYGGAEGENKTEATVVWTEKSAMCNVPIEENYRTNFYGSFLTAEGTVNVKVDKEFESTNNVDVNAKPDLNEIFADENTVAYTLTTDYVLDEPLVFSAEKEFVLDLAGHSITASKDLWNEDAKIWSLISVQNGSLTIQGEGKVEARENDSFAVDVRNGAELTIEGGQYVGNLTAIYVHTGKATINDGTFSIKQVQSDPNLNPYCGTLNCYDPSFTANGASIVVNGGSFYMFNPESDALGAEVGHSFLGEGVTASLDEDTNYYTVASL